MAQAARPGTLGGLSSFDSFTAENNHRRGTATTSKRKALHPETERKDDGKATSRATFRAEINSILKQVLFPADDAAWKQEQVFAMVKTIKQGTLSFIHNRLPTHPIPKIPLNLQGVFLGYQFSRWPVNRGCTSCSGNSKHQKNDITFEVLQRCVTGKTLTQLFLQGTQDLRQLPIRSL